MNPAKLDHIVIGAATREEGVLWAESLLGVSVPRGGKHSKMATHNCVMSLGGDCYLEIVAIDPDAGSVDRGRWFGLDTPQVRQALNKGPRLLTWAVNTDDIHAAIGRVTAAGYAQSLIIESMSRDSLQWEVSFDESGKLIENGLFPLVLQWHVSEHPSRAMADLNCSLKSVEVVSRDPESLREQLNATGALWLVEDNLRAGQSDELIVTLQTPLGERRLSSLGDVEEIEQ